MPELPEVETMVRGLRPALEGRRLRSVRVCDPFLIRGCTSQELERRAKGARVTRVDRRGKWVVLTLGDRRGIIVIQPRMTGGFWLVPPVRPEHIRLTFTVDGSHDMVWFCDTRRLGRIEWFCDADTATQACAKSQGPDALEIAADELARRLSRTARGIKPALLDQKVLAGIGNIYADEVLFHAGVHATRRSDRLRPDEVAKIHQAIGVILAAAIAAEGSSFDASYRTVLGEEGGYLARSAVHRRKGKPCPRCGTSIVKAAIPGLISRPTYFCPRCQRAPRGRKAQ